MLKSIFGLVTDGVRIIAAPVEMAVDLTRAVTKPVADVAQEIAKDIKTALKE